MSLDGSDAVAAVESKISPCVSKGESNDNMVEFVDVFNDLNALS